MVFLQLDKYRFFKTDFFDFLEEDIEEEDIDFLLTRFFLTHLERAQEEPIFLVFFFPTTTPGALAEAEPAEEDATPERAGVSLASALIFKRRLRARNLPKRGEATGGLLLATSETSPTGSEREEGESEGKATLLSCCGGAEDRSSTGAAVAEALV